MSTSTSRQALGIGCALGISLGLGILLGLGACDSGSPGNNNSDGGADMTEPTGDAMVRIGHFTIDVGAFDVCLKGPADTAFQGPIIKAKLQRSGGVPYANLSDYFPLTPATYSVRVVPGAATNCNTAIGGLPDINNVEIKPGRHYTELALGRLLPSPTGIQFKVFEDDLTPTAGSVRMRVINGSPDLPSVDVGQSPGGKYMPLLTGAAYGATGSSGGNTYAVFSPITNVNLTLRDSGSSTDRLNTNPISLDAGAVVTVSVIGSPGAAGSPVELVRCIDTNPGKLGLADCKELQ